MLEFTGADFDRPLTRHEELASKDEEMFGGKNPAQTIEVSKTLGRDYGTVKTQLHIACKRGLLKSVKRCFFHYLNLATYAFELLNKGRDPLENALLLG